MMASGFVKLNRTKAKFQPSWLQENLEEMNQTVKKMTKLIEDDADSFAKKAELYFKRRPEMLSLVEEFHRMYRVLAEKYDHVTGELRKNVPSDLQSQGSGVSDAGSEPLSTALSSDRRPNRSKPGPRAAGFDFFLGSVGSGSDINSKEGDDTSTTLDSESESDDSSVNNYASTRSNGVEQGLRGRVIELEGELREAREKLRIQKQEISEGFKKSNLEVQSRIAAYEDEQRVAREKIRLYEEEIRRLTGELQKYEASGDSNNVVRDSTAVVDNDSQDLDSKLDQVKELERSIPESFSLHRIQTLEEGLRIAQEKLRESKEEVTRLSRDLSSKGSSTQSLQDQLKSAQKEVSSSKNKVDREKREVSKLQDRIARYKANLADRDQEIRGLREAMSNANKSLSEENDQLQSEMTRMTKERAYLEDSLKEMDLRCQSLEEEVRRVKAAKDEMESMFGAQIDDLTTDISQRDEIIDGLNTQLAALTLKHEALIALRDELDAKISTLGAEMNSKDDQITQLSSDLHRLQTQHGELISEAEELRKLADELGLRMKELETEVEVKQETILEGAAGKREAIRQLCVSLEYYRGVYHELRQALIAYKGPAVTAK